MKKRIERDRLLAAAMQGLPVSVVSAFGAYQGRRYAQKAVQRQARWVERLYHNLEFLHGRRLDDDERWQSLKAYAEQLGRVYAEICVLPRLVHSAKFHIVNPATVQPLSGPYVVVVPHLANWEAVGDFLGRALPSVHVLYEPRETKTRMALAMRTRQAMMPNATFVSTTDPRPMKTLMKALSQGGSVLILPDEPGRNGGIPAFGKRPLTQGNRWMAARLAASYGAQILPLCVSRQQQAEMTLTVHPTLPMELRLTVEEQAIQYAEQMDSLFETWVRQAPTDWYWLKDTRLT